MSPILTALLCVLVFVILSLGVIMLAFAMDDIILKGHFAKKLRRSLGVEE